MLIKYIFLGIFGLYQSLTINAEIYHFTDLKDREICKRMKFTKVSTNRRASTEKMTRRSADSCCRIRGMTLYTAEKMDEPQTFSKQMQEKLDESLLYWVSANSFVEKGKFVWEGGKGVDEGDLRSYKWDNHSWSEGEPGKGRCVVIKAEDERILMKSARCDKETHPFICEMEAKVGGKDLTVTELMNCMGSNFTDVPGYPSLKIFESLGTWRTASMCCQAKGWSLVDNIANKGKKFYETIANHPWGPGLTKELFYWTSGNDFQEFRNWKWGCGDQAEDLDWYMDESTNVTSPDNKMGNENCLVYTDKNSEKGFSGEDYDCDFKTGSIMCDTFPKCPVEEQYSMGTKEPRTYDMLDTFQEDLASCKSANFKLMKVKEGNKNLNNLDHTIHAGDQKMSWAASMKCCKDHGMEGLSLKNRDMKSAMDRIMFEDATAGDRGWDPRKIYWVSASNLNGPAHSELKWSDDKTVKSEVMNPIKIHDNIHPVCGQLGYIPPKGFFVHTANCLNKNYVICSKKNISPKKPGARIQLPVDDIELYNKSLSFPTEEELLHNFVNLNRDRCPIIPDFEAEYNASCEGSAFRGSDLRQNITTTNSTYDIKYKINSQNKRILDIAIKNGVLGYKVPDHSPNYGFKLLEISTDILTKMCPIIPPELIQSAYQLFHEVHWMTSQGRTEVLKMSDYKWILKLLEKCANSVKPFPVLTDNCGDKMIAVDNCTEYICTNPNSETKISRTDPLVDIIWKSFEMAHTHCFPFFEESYRMYHQYGRAIIDLWSSEIRVRWSNQHAGHPFWVRLLGDHYDTHLLNIERCVEASIADAFLPVRIPRNTLPDRTRLLDEKEAHKASQ